MIRRVPTTQHTNLFEQGLQKPSAGAGALIRAISELQHGRCANGGWRGKNTVAVFSCIDQLAPRAYVIVLTYAAPGVGSVSYHDSFVVDDAPACGMKASAIFSCGIIAASDLVKLDCS